MGFIKKIKYLLLSAIAFASVFAIATGGVSMVPAIGSSGSNNEADSAIIVDPNQAKPVGSSGINADLYEVNTAKGPQYFVRPTERVNFQEQSPSQSSSPFFPLGRQFGQTSTDSDPNNCDPPKLEYPEANRIIPPSQKELNTKLILSQIYNKISRANGNEGEPNPTIPPISGGTPDPVVPPTYTPPVHSGNDPTPHTRPTPHYPGESHEPSILDRNLGSLQKSAEKSLEYSNGRHLASRAASRMRELEDKNYEDQKSLSQAFSELSPEELRENLPRAQKYILDDLRLIEQRHAALEKEKDRYRAIYLNAFDKTKHAEEFLSHFAKEKAIQAVQPFSGLFSPKKDHPLAKADAFKEIFGETKPLESASTADALVNRTMMLASLPEAKRNEILEKLNLVESVSVQLPNGKKDDLKFLHTGYVFGGGKTAIDCSSFVSSLLPIDLRKSNLTTMDFYGIYSFLMTGKMPSPPSWNPSRSRWLKKVALSFEPVDIYNGEYLLPGDLLIVRIVINNSGHILIVQDFDPKTASTDVIEASFTSGKINTRKFPLSLDPVTAQVRRFRPGLFALRLSSRPQACQYASNDSERRKR